MLDAGYLWEEPGAGKPPARICEGEAEWPSYSTTTHLWALSWHAALLAKTRTRRRDDVRDALKARRRNGLEFR